MINIKNGNEIKEQRMGRKRGIEEEITKLIHKDIEKETRVEEKPVPPSQLDRIERMLKFLCIRARVMDFKDLDDASAMPLHGKALVRLKKLLKASPDISDIIEKK